MGFAETNSTSTRCGALGAAGAEPLAGAQHLRERRRQPGVGDEQVQEAGPGDLEALEAGAQPALQGAAETLGDLPRRRPRPGASSSAAFVE